MLIIWCSAYYVSVVHVVMLLGCPLVLGMLMAGQFSVHCVFLLVERSSGWILSLFAFDFQARSLRMIPG
jgi:hypothetical protein